MEEPFQDHLLVFTFYIWQKKIFQANALKIQVGIDILISDKIDFKPKLIRRDREHFVLIKGKKISKWTFQFLASMHQIQGNPSLENKNKENKNTTAA